MRLTLATLLTLLVAAPSLAAPVEAYIQAGTPTSMTVMWTSQRAVPGTLKVTQPGSAWNRTLVGPVTTRHTFRVDGLAPGTQYEYAAHDPSYGGGTGKFRTNNSPDQQRYRFAVMGDSGSGSKNQYGIAYQLKRWKPDFVLHTGDVVYEKGEAANYGPRFIAPYRDLISSTVLYPSLGNHDYVTGQAQAYRDFFEVPNVSGGREERWYAFDYGHARFYGLDSNAPFSQGSPQYRWLAAELAQSKARWKFAYFHHPAYSGGMHGSSHTLRSAWGPLFERHNVQVVFTGHDHHYERTTPREDFVHDGVPTTYLVTGGAGAWLRAAKRQSFTAAVAVQYHFLGVELTGDRLTGEAIGLDGRAFDRWIINLP